MLTVNNVRDWLATLLPTDTIYAGFIDAKTEQCLGVYQRDTGGWNQAIGAPSTYQRFYCKVLVHWGKDIRDCTQKAAAVFDLIHTNRKGMIDGHQLIDIQAERPPIQLGRDESMIWESIVVFTIIYETED
jgi:hypothetical protein